MHNQTGIFPVTSGKTLILLNDSLINDGAGDDNTFKYFTKVFFF